MYNSKIKIMKNFMKISLFLLLTILLISCNNNDEDSDTSSSGDFFTAKVDGQTWTAFIGPPDTIAWNEAHTGLIVLQGSDSSGKAISMNIMNYSGKGIYDFSTAGFVQYVIAPTQANSGTWVCNAGSNTTGSVEITSDDGTIIEGNVSFTAKNNQDSSTKVITEGKFRATKQ